MNEYDDEDEAIYYSDEYISQHLENSQYKILSSQEVVELMNTEINKVKSIALIPETKIRILLNKYKWDIEKFLDKYYEENENKENVDILPPFTVAVSPDSQDPPKGEENLIPRRTTRSMAQKRSRDISIEYPEPVKRTRLIKKNYTCDICFDDTLSSINSWNCGHKVCNDCLKQFLSSAISNRQFVGAIECPGYQCETLLDDEEVVKYLDPTELLKYKQVIADGYVSQNRMLRWCPGEKCTNAIQMIDITTQPAVICSCGKHFCFKCSNEVHDLIPCDLMILFKEIQNNQLDSASYVAKNCKPCPNCKAEIEKNGGCKHMICSNCTHEFCWLCLSPWNKTGHIHQCSFDKVDESQVPALTDSRRLYSIHSKYCAALQSIEFDRNNKEKVMEKAHQITANDCCFNSDVVDTAIDVLIKSRSALADSYIFQLFMENDKNNQWLCFQMNQNKLEFAIENLFFILENKLEINEANDVQLKIIDGTKYCKQLLKAVGDQIREGFEKNWWKTM